MKIQFNLINQEDNRTEFNSKNMKGQFVESYSLMVQAKKGIGSLDKNDTLQLLQLLEVSLYWTGRYWNVCVWIRDRNKNLFLSTSAKADSKQEAFREALKKVGITFDRSIEPNNFKQPLRLIALAMKYKKTFIINSHS